MPPGVAGDEKALDPDPVDIQNLPVCKQHLLIVDSDLRQLIEVIDHLAADFTSKIMVFNLADIELCVPEQPGTVRFHRAHVVGVLMGDEDVPDGRWINAQPAHLFLQPVVVVSGVDHDGRVALAVEEDVGHPFPDAGHVLVHPAGVQGLENLLAAVHLAHFSFLKFGRFL